MSGRSKLCVPCRIKRFEALWLDHVFHKDIQEDRCSEVIPWSACLTPTDQDINIPSSRTMETNVPSQHCSVIFVVAFASGDCVIERELRVCPGVKASGDTYTDDPRVGDVCTIPIPRCKCLIVTFPRRNPSATRTVRKCDVLKPSTTESQ